MKSPMVSIVVLTYNHENYIHQAIESILKQQTTFDFEIVIGDDASTDDTVHILKKLELENPEVLKITFHSTNIGMIPNFVDTINNCRGKYIAFCEGDDYWTDSEKLQIQIDFLENNHQYGICFHDANIYDESSKTLEPDSIANSEKEEYDLHDLAKGNFMHTPTVVIKNDFSLPETFTTLPIGDWPLYMLMLNNRKIKRFNRVMAVYRIHDKSSWSSKSIAFRYEKTLFTIKFLLTSMELDNIQKSTLEGAAKHYTKKLYKLQTSPTERLKNKFISLFR